MSGSGTTSASISKKYNGQETSQKTNPLPPPVPSSKKDSTLPTESSKRKGTVCAVLPRNPAKDYFEPTLKSAFLEYTADLPVYEPTVVNDGQSAVLKVKSSDRISLNHRTTVTINTGLKVDCGSGFKVRVEGLTDLASRGLFVAGSFQDQESRLFVIVTNIGKEIIALTDKDSFAVLSVEPIYIMKFNQPRN